MLGLGLVPLLHPDPGERGVDEQVVGAQRVRPFRRPARGVEPARGEVDLGEGMPGVEGIGRGGRGPIELGEGAVRVPHRMVIGRVLDQGLEFVGGHGAAKRARPAGKLNCEPAAARSARGELQDQHRVAVAEETVALADGLRVDFPHPVDAGGLAGGKEGGHQAQQG